MKRQSLSLLCGLFSVCLLAGCGGHNNNDNSSNTNTSDACGGTVNAPYPRTFLGNYQVNASSTAPGLVGTFRLIVTADGTSTAFFNEGTDNALTARGTANIGRETVQLAGTIPAADGGTETVSVDGEYASDACVSLSTGQITVNSARGTQTGSFTAGPTQTGVAAM